jgi:hypothetical protein
MKNRNEWVRQPMVDKAANEFVAEGKQLGDITAYQVAKRLGCSPNSEIHKKFYDWQRRRQEEAGPSPVDVPSSAEAEFEAALNRLTRASVLTIICRWPACSLDRGGRHSRSSTRSGSRTALTISSRLFPARLQRSATRSSSKAP